MKILKLHFKNLNSLAGEWTIDFTDPAFSEGLFLLHGETGSGKTTVLDAITLALYGETPRLGHIGGQSNEIMTRRTGVCFAEVDFVANDGSHYRARWEQHRARDRAAGKLQGHGLSLTNLATNCEIPATKKQMPGLIESKVGLSFAQFQRTIMLAQGKFSEFLAAKPDARADILEQATGTEIYARIGRLIFERMSEAAVKCGRIRDTMSGIVPFTDEERADIGRQIADAEEKEAGLRPVVEALERQRAWHVEAAAVAKESAALDADEAGLREDDAAFAADGARLEAARRAATADSLHAALCEARRRQTAATEDRDAREAALKRDAAALPALVEAMDAAKNDLLTAQETFRMEGERIAQAMAVHEAGTRKRGDEKQAKQALAGADNAHRNTLVDIDATKEERKNAQNALELRRESVNQFAPKLAAAESRLRELQTALEKAHTSVETVQRECNLRRPELEMALDVAQNALLFASTVQNLDEERRNLVPGRPCPLCGAMVERLDALAGVQVTSATAKCQEIREAIAALDNGVKAARDDADERQRDVTRCQRYVEQIREMSGEFDAQKKADIARLEATVAGCDARIGTLSARLAEEAKAKTEAEEAYRAAHDEVERLLKVFAGFMIPNDNPEAYRASLQATLDNAAKAEVDARTKLTLAEKTVETDRAELEAADGRMRAANSEFETARLAFAARLAELAIEDESAWHLARWDDDAIRDAAERSQALHDRATELSARREALRARKALLDGSPDRTRRTAEAIAAELEKRKAECAVAHDSATRLRTRLDEDDTAVARVGELRRRLEEATVESQRWTLLNRMLGGQDGKFFRRYAQSVTLRELLAHANVHLRMMSSDRYTLEWRPQKAGAKESLDELLPTVRDALQGDEIRPVATLSGGETFQVSLALALGLADMNAGNVRIESLFLDEGFGTLDGESLERALETLESVQRSGRLLGIISHIPALAERIPTKIEVRKRGGGRSGLSGPGVTSLKRE